MVHYEGNPQTRAETKRRDRTRFFVPTFLICAVAAVGLADSQLVIDRWTLNGGAKSSGGALSIDGTIGQSVTGTATGGALALTGGIWMSGDESSSGAPPLETLPERFVSHGFAPNPLARTSTLTLDLPHPVAVRIDVFSVDGGRVAGLLDRTVSAGRLRVHWDATGPEGRRLPAGVYLLTVQAGADRATERVIVLD